MDDTQISNHVEGSEIDQICLHGRGDYDTMKKQDYGAKDEIVDDIEKDETSKYSYLVIVTMCMSNFISFANFSIIAPIFPPLAQEKGMSQSIVGFVVGFYFLVVCVVSPFIGVLISRVGVKFISVGGAFFSAVCGILFGVLEYGPGGTVYITFCFITRGFFALGTACLEITTYSIVSNLYPSRLITYFSLLETMCGLGMTAGPAIGGFLYQVGGYYLPFCVTGGLLMIIGVIIAVVLPPIKDTNDQKGYSIQRLGYFITRPTIILIIYTICNISFSVAFLEPTFAGYLIEFHLEPYQIGLMFLLPAGCYAIAGPIYGIICDKKGYLMTMMIAGLLFYGVGYMFIAPASFMNIKPALWICIVASTVVGVGNAAAFVPVFAALNITAVQYGFEDNFNTNSMVSGVFISAFAFGGFLGATIAGILVERIGFNSSVFVVSVLLLINFLLLTIYALIKRKSCQGRDIFDKMSSIKYTEIIDP